MTDREIKTIDDLLESNLAQQKFLFRMANVKWHRMKEKEAHLDKHQHSREFWQACGRVCSARKLIAAYETLIRLWEKERSLHQRDRKEMICGTEVLAKP